MPWKNFIIFILSMLTFISLFAIGGSIAAHSWFGVIGSIIGVIVFMGAGFSLKRKFKTIKG